MNRAKEKRNLGGRPRKPGEAAYVRVPRALYDAVKREAQRDRRTFSFVLRDLLLAGAEATGFGKNGKVKGGRVA